MGHQTTRVMKKMSMSNESISYCLQQLSGFEPSDIEDDTFEIAVNDDQFTTMSITCLAKYGHEAIDSLTEKVSKMEFMINNGLGWEDMKGGERSDVE